MRDAYRLAILTELRQDANLTLTDMARRCGLRGRHGHQTAGAWESGQYVPNERSRRAPFIGYLWDDLGLRQDVKRFEAVWKILVEEWRWMPLTDVEWQSFTSALRPDSTNVFTSNESGAADVARVKRTIIPRQNSPFLGRKRELRTTTEILQDINCRLLTLVGPGGIGKTRLAQQIAQQLAEYFTDGVCFVSLVSVEGQSDMVASIVQTLMVPATKEGDLSQTLLTWLSSKTLLLVLDNLEQLIEESDFLTQILLWCPQVKILVTSRVRLNLSAEWVFDVPGLEVPPDEQELTRNLSGEEPSILASYGSTELFVHYAQRAQITFSLDNENCAHVVRICQLVGGMPLAIELAAAWVRTLTCAEIADEIILNLDFLATRLRDTVERHRSMRAVFEYSWQLLSPIEQQTLLHLSIFRGGFDRQAAIRVAGIELPMLATLIDKSFLQSTTSERYEMHELLRQLIAEELQQWPHTAAEITASYIKWYTEFLTELNSQFQGKQATKSIQKIQVDIQNIRRVWRHLIDHGIGINWRKLRQRSTNTMSIQGVHKKVPRCLALPILRS